MSLLTEKESRDMNRTGPLRPPVLGKLVYEVDLRALRTAARATERERA